MDDVYRFCDGEWEKSGIVMERGRGAAGSVRVGSKVYVMGGNVGGHGEQGDVKSWTDVYDFESEKWEELEDMPNGRDHFQCVVVGKEIVCPGGRDSGVNDFFNKNEERVDVLDTGKGTWRTLKSKVRTPRAGGMVGVLGGKVLFAGGEGSGKAYDLVEVLDVEKDEWSVGPSMNSPRHGTGTIMEKGRVVVAGGSGVQGEGNFAKTIEVLEESESDSSAPGSSPKPSGEVSSGENDSSGENEDPKATASEDDGDTSATGGEDGDSTSSSTPNPSSSSGSGRKCFPASAQVELQSGVKKDMSEIEIGDIVRVGSDLFSEVFFFTHRDADMQSAFVQIETANATRLKLSPSHYLYVNGQLTAARNVQVGDKIHVITSTSNIPQSTIISVTRRIERGLYNPHTLHGDIVVDGVRTSTFTEAVEPSIAKGLLSPLKWLYGGSRMIRMGSDLFNKLNDNVLKVFEQTVWANN